jgi:cytosine/adenosine deaminase-related metal-dependent hydrolase
MATSHGAWALGLGRTAGRITPGGPADLAILRPDSAPRGDPFVAALDPGTVVTAVLRHGRVIAGRLG